MRRRHEPRDARRERLLNGQTSGLDADAQKLATFITSVRAGYVQAPDDATEAKHLAAISQACRSEALSETPSAPAGRFALGALGTGIRNRRLARPFQRLRRTLTVLAVAAGTVLTMAALAVAGVTLPGPVRAIAQAVGLPNQADRRATGSPSHVPVKNPPRGCRFGQAVADRASDGKATADDPCDRTKSKPKSKNGSARRNERSKSRQENAARAREQNGGRSQGSGRSRGSAGKSRRRGDSQGSGGSGTSGRPPAAGKSHPPSSPRDRSSSPKPSGKPPGRRR